MYQMMYGDPSDRALPQEYWDRLDARLAKIGVPTRKRAGMSIEMDIAIVERVLGGFCADPDAWSETDEVRYYLYTAGTPHVVRGVAYEYPCLDNWTGYTRRYSRKWTRFAPSERIEDAWVVVEQMALTPRTPEESERMVYTRFRLWWKNTSLWVMSEQEAAEAICAAALAAVEKETV